MKLSIGLIEDAGRHWWRLASMRLAMISGVIIAYYVEHPGEWNDLIQLLPEWVYPFRGPLLGVLAALIAGGSRMVTFRKSKP